jgi:uncharacterized membrane protein
MRGTTLTVAVPKNRLEGLADGLFAIVMTLLVLELHIPVIGGSSVDAELLTKLLELWPRLLVYMLSFVILGTMWVNHHFMFHCIARSDGKLAWMNIIILMCVALIPFSASLLGEYSAAQVAVAVYGVNILLIITLGSAIWMYVTRNPALADRPIDAEVAKRRTIMYLVGWLSYALGISVSFVSPVASISIYTLATLMSIIFGWQDSQGFLSAVLVRRRRNRERKG